MEQSIDLRLDLRRALFGLNERDRLRDEVLDLDFPEMAAARANMDPKVILPEPRWPKFF